MATFVVLRHPVTILVTIFTNPKNLTNDLLILKLLIKTDLQALTLVGPTMDSPVLDPLAVLHLAN